MVRETHKPQIVHSGWTKIADFERHKQARPEEPTQEPVQLKERIPTETALFNAIERNEVVEFHYIYFDSQPFCIFHDKVFAMVANANPSLGYDLREATIDKKRFLQDPFFITETQALDALFSKKVPVRRGQKSKKAGKAKKPNYYTGIQIVR